MNSDAPDSHQQPRPPSLFESASRAPVTVGFALGCILVAFWTNLGTSMDAVRWLTFVDLFDSAAGGTDFPGLDRGQAWRLVTPIFIHFGILHLVFNLMWLWDLGGLIESRWKSVRFLCLVLIIGVLANAAQFAVNGDFTHGIHFANALSGGMSGVVYGLFGYVWMRSKRDPSLHLRLNQQTVMLMLGWMIFCLTGMMGHVGNTAHVVGLLIGVIAGLVDSRASERRAE